MPVLPPKASVLLPGAIPPPGLTPALKVLLPKFGGLLPAGTNPPVGVAALKFPAKRLPVLAPVPLIGLLPEKEFLALLNPGFCAKPWFALLLNNEGVVLAP